MKKLTEKQLAMLNFIRSFGEENGCPPTIKECASHFSISLHEVQCNFEELKKDELNLPHLFMFHRPVNIKS